MAGEMCETIYWQYIDGMSEILLQGEDKRHKKANNAKPLECRLCMEPAVFCENMSKSGFI